MPENIAPCGTLSANEHFKKDCDFKMNTTGSYWIARVYLGKQYLSFTYEELRNLSYIMYMIQNEMFYTTAMTDVIADIDTAHDSVAFLEPPSTANKSIDYYQLLEEIKSINSLNHTLYLCTHDLYFSDAINYAYLKTKRACAVLISFVYH